MIYESNYLMHHGIKGQKWGVENGPPYPLSLKDYTAAEKRQAKISDKLSALKYETTDEARNAGKLYENWRHNKDLTTFEDQMAYTKRIRKDIDSLQQQVNKMPKNSKDFSKFINELTLPILFVIKAHIKDL